MCPPAGSQARALPRQLSLPPVPAAPHGAVTSSPRTRARRELTGALLHASWGPPGGGRLRCRTQHSHPHWRLSRPSSGHSSSSSGSPVTCWTLRQHPQCQATPGDAHRASASSESLLHSENPSWPSLALQEAPKQCSGPAVLGTLGPHLGMVRPHLGTPGPLLGMPRAHLWMLGHAWVCLNHTSGCPSHTWGHVVLTRD